MAAQNKNIFFFGPPEQLSLPSNDLYADPDVSAAYHTVLASVFNATLPSPAARAVSSQLADEIIAMEKKLVAIIPPLEDQRDVKLYYTPSNLTATAALAPVLGLDIYLKAMAPANYTFDYMITAFPDYLRKMNDILLATPKRALQAYFMWNLISTSKSLVIAPEVEVINRFSRILNGQVSFAPTGLPRCFGRRDPGGRVGTRRSEWQADPGQPPRTPTRRRSDGRRARARRRATSTSCWAASSSRRPSPRRPRRSATRSWPTSGPSSSGVSRRRTGWTTQRARLPLTRSSSSTRRLGTQPRSVFHPARPPSMPVRANGRNPVLT